MIHIIFFYTQDMYNCLTEDQRKFLLEKEQMMKLLKEKEESFSVEKEVLLNKQKDLENGKFHFDST